LDFEYVSRRNIVCGGEKNLIKSKRNNSDILINGKEKGEGRVKSLVNRFAMKRIMNRDELSSAERATLKGS